ncbi:ATP-binding protein [Haloimpatiens sp. FM7330]|uniref:HAMP domain-containing sensor histidine kinase n=1 Tax=Haloimpatiens sp. FM7330 TaxID=3298610 RepID=UPI0036322A79
MKNRKSMKKFFFQNCIFIILLVVVMYMVSLRTSNSIIEHIMFKDLDLQGLEAENLLKYPYDKINTNTIEELYGWIEILDENKNVVFVKGNKQDNIYHYDERFLYDNSVLFHNDDEKYPIMYCIYPIKGPNKEKYLFLIKIPKKYFSISMSFKLFMNPLNSTKLHLLGTSILFITFIIFILASTYIYSKIISKHITKPLTNLKNGLKEMKKFNYKVRLNFKAEKEIEEIKDIFNDMACELMNTKIKNDKLEKSKQQMLIDLSHDLKTPITSIQGFSKLVYDNETINEEDKKRYIKYIYDKSIYVTNLIEDLFQLVKLEDEHFQFKFVKDNFTEWFRVLVAEFYPEFEKKNFIINVDISEVPTIINFDKKQMTRAITNIFSNSLKYNKENTELNIYCYNEHNNLVLRISDNGIGIKEEYKELIFEPFTRVDESRTSKDGTGLGLSITKKIIEKHKGTIVLDQNEKEKTIFLIKLPICNI